MADGWQPGLTQSDGLPYKPSFYTGGDPYKLNERFSYPDVTDEWPEPNYGDDLGKNSGRYYTRVQYGPEKGKIIPQREQDAFVLQGRLNRLQLIKAIREDKAERERLRQAIRKAVDDARYAVVEAAFYAMLDSVKSKYEYDLLYPRKADFIAKYGRRGAVLPNTPAFFIQTWRAKVGLET